MGTAEQKGFLKGEDIYFARLKGKQKESVAFQPSLQQVACRLHPQLELWGVTIKCNEVEQDRLEHCSVAVPEAWEVVSKSAWESFI